jgi:hypothetical protein
MAASAAGDEEALEASPWVSSDDALPILRKGPPDTSLNLAIPGDASRNPGEI